MTTSKADQVIVLGDRNMKNHSCQAKRKGKLVEMKVRYLNVRHLTRSLSWMK